MPYHLRKAAMDVRRWSIVDMSAKNVAALSAMTVTVPINIVLLPRSSHRFIRWKYPTCRTHIMIAQRLRCLTVVAAKAVGRNIPSPWTLIMRTFKAIDLGKVMIQCKTCLINYDDTVKLCQSCRTESWISHDQSHEIISLKFQPVEDEAQSGFGCGKCDESTSYTWRKPVSLRANQSAFNLLDKSTFNSSWARWLRLESWSTSTRTRCQCCLSLVPKKSFSEWSISGHGVCSLQTWYGGLDKMPVIARRNNTIQTSQVKLWDFVQATVRGPSAMNVSP